MRRVVGRLLVGASALTILASTALAFHPAAPVGTVEDMMEADRAFFRASAERGIDGWMSFMAPDAARLQGPIGSAFVTGHEAIRAQDAPLLDSDQVQLRWEPEHGHMFDDGRTGFTTGPYQVVELATGNVVGSGSYVSYWRLTDDGWKVAFDAGTADPPQ